VLLPTSAFWPKWATLTPNDPNTNNKAYVNLAPVLVGGQL